MNYNFLSQLVDNGISEEELIASISRSVPRLANQARKMFFGGWSPKDVLGMFSKDKEAQKVARKGLKPVTPSEMATYNLRNSYNNIPQSSGQESKQKLTEFTKKAAPLALGALASPLAGSVIQSALQRALPQTDMLPDNVSSPIPDQPQTPNQPITPNPLGNSNQYDTAQQPPLSNVNAASIPEPANINQPQSNQSLDLKALLKDKYEGFKGKIDDLLKSGNTKKAIAGYLRKFGGGTVSQLEKESGQPLEKIIDQYISENPTKITTRKEIEERNKSQLPEEQIQPEVQNQPELQQNEPIATLSEPSATLKEEIATPKIEKNSVVSSPQGIGEVKEIRNGTALVEVDGKLHKVKEEDLQSEPEEVRDAKLGFDPETVPENLRSAPLNEVYLPHDKRHVTVKYNAGLKPIRYLYFRKDGQQISNDYINKIVQGLQLPVSSGKSFWGTWNADESDSRGAANYDELVKNSQEEGEPDDPSKEYWFIKEEALYEHPYMEKAGKEELRRKEKEFNEAKKKRKKKTA